MKKTVSLLLILCLALGMLAGCGNKNASVAETSTPAATETLTQETEKPVQPVEEESSAVEVSAHEEKAEGYVSPYTVSYPIPGDDNVLSMIQCLRNNAAALIEKDYTEQFVYPYLAEAAGVEVEFIMIAEAALTEQLNLRISSQNYPDIFGQGIGSYDSNAMKAVEDGVIIDLTDIIEENAPEYYTILQNIPDFAEQIYNSDGSICKISSCNVGI